jgi:RNA methyltransferase, TrmH family
MTQSSPPPARDDEERLYGLHACRAVFKVRPADVRKLWLDEARLDDVRDLLRICASRGVAYKIVGAEDIAKLTRSTHHEGLCLIAARRTAPGLEEVLESLPPTGPARVLLLENVRDPHNVGAILRTAAHFGTAAALATGATATRSAALVRTAEGGAESVPLLPTPDPARALALLAEKGFVAVATASRAAAGLYEGKLPERAVLMLGAEREGLSPALMEAAAAQVRIDGSGAVESLNVATAAGVLLAEHWRLATRPGLAPPQGRSTRGTRPSGGQGRR